MSFTVEVTHRTGAPEYYDLDFLVEKKAREHKGQYDGWGAGCDGVDYFVIFKSLHHAQLFENDLMGEVGNAIDVSIYENDEED